MIKTLKVVLITCYFQPDYVRSRSLRAAFSGLENVETIIIKNSRLGLLRYPEVLWKTVSCRFKDRPDIYVLCFRGQEILPAILLLALGKPIIFDEFIVPLAWATGETHRRTLRTAWFRFLTRLSTPLYKSWLRSCRAILTDTLAHAELSASLSGVPLNRYAALPVGTDETLFKPAFPRQNDSKLPFIVFFYGLKMTPLHGLEYILEAATALNSRPDISFTIVGGDAVTQTQVEAARTRGARISYEQFVPFEQIATMMQQADLCLGGPFGDTPQARRVVTGKTYQSLACANPTVIGMTDVGASFIDKKNCLLVPLGSSSDLMRTIVWAADHRRELALIGKNGRLLYETEFSTKVITDRLKDVLSLADPNAAGPLRAR